MLAGKTAPPLVTTVARDTADGIGRGVTTFAAPVGASVDLVVAGAVATTGSPAWCRLDEADASTVGVDALLRDVRARCTPDDGPLVVETRVALEAHPDLTALVREEADAHHRGRLVVLTAAPPTDGRPVVSFTRLDVPAALRRADARGVVLTRRIARRLVALADGRPGLVDAALASAWHLGTWDVSRIIEASTNPNDLVGGLAPALLGCHDAHERALLTVLAVLGYWHPRWAASLGSAPGLGILPWWQTLDDGWYRLLPHWRLPLTARLDAGASGPLVEAVVDRLVADGAPHEALTLATATGRAPLARRVLADGAVRSRVAAGDPLLVPWAARLGEDAPVTPPARRRWRRRAREQGDASDPPTAPGTGTSPDAAADTGDASVDDTHRDERAAPAPGPLRRTAMTVQLFGDLVVTIDGYPVTQWSGQLGRAILRYLVARRQPVARDVLITHLWPDVDPERGRNRLHVALHALRRDLARLTDRPVVVHEGGAYRIDPSIDLWLDVADFEEHLAAARRARERGDAEDELAHTERAVTLVRGELLADVPWADWAVLEREANRLAHLDALDRLATLHLARGDLPACVRACQAAVGIDACRESAHRLLIRCFLDLGQPQLALRQYRLCEALLRAELGVAPSPATAALLGLLGRPERGGSA